MDYALQVIRKKLTNDPSWKTVTELTLDNILTLLEFCLTTTYFVCVGVFYKQVHGAPMGSPVSPGVADLTMEDFEEEVMRTVPEHLKPQVWYRYVDDTFTVLHEYAIEEFTQFINSRNPHIKFTMEEEEHDQLPFLDTCVLLQDDGSLETKVYRKPTHTDQYLNWDSNHHLEHKRSVVRTLLRRAERIVSREEDKKKEVKHVKKVLKVNGYRNWIFKLPKKKTGTEQVEPEPGFKKKKTPVALPYIKGLSEKLQRIFRQHGIQSFHKPFNSLRSMIVKPKDNSEKMKKCGVVYSVKCGTCDKEYIGETARALGTRMKEHTDGKHQSSAITEHQQVTGHLCDTDNVKVLTQEERLFPRKIREALKIHQRRPALNRDKGYEIPPVILQLLPRDFRSHVTSTQQ